MAAPARVTECGFTAPSMQLGPSSFDALWRASRLGLTGGDAALSAQLPDGRELWVFGDSFVGGLRPDGTRPRDTQVVRNTVVVQDGRCMTTFFRRRGTAASALWPAREDPYLGWYWPNQPFVRDGNVFVFLTHLHRTDPTGWGFEADGSALAVLRLPGLEPGRLEPVATAPHTYFGVTTLARPGLTYVFGVDERTPGARGLLVARVRGPLPRGSWEYWNGGAWVRAAAAARPVADLPSNQFSVLDSGDGRLVLVSQPANGEDVLTYTAAAPTGPWTPGSVAARVPRLPGLMTYNAALHPEFSAGGSMLLSYSVNCTTNSLDAVADEPWNYLPRFTTARLP